MDDRVDDREAFAEFPSLAESWSRRNDLAPMPWTLGVVGDLLWNIFPQLRTAIRDLMVKNIDRAIVSGESIPVHYGDDLPSDDQLFLPESHDYITFIVRPKVLDDVASGRATPTLLRMLCRYIRLLLTFDGECGPTEVAYAEEIIEDIGTPAGKAAIASVDPELSGFIEGRLRMWRT